MNKKAFSKASVYVGTYAKYNAGSIYGDWLMLSDYADIEDFYEACRELHSDETDPEFMFQDWEGVPEGTVTECTISPAIFELMEELDESQEASFKAWAEYSCEDWKKDVSKAVQDYESAYLGEYDSEAEYAEELFTEIYGSEIPPHLMSYIDFEAYARDIFSDGYTYYDSYVFCF